MHRTIALGILLALPITCGAQTTSNPPRPAAGSESLGNQLLKDLPGGTHDSATSKQSHQPATQDEDGSKRAMSRFDDLGEDIGQPSGPLALARIRQGMQRARSLLSPPAATPDSGAIQQATTIQKQVVDQLDQLIAELSKQCQGGQCSPGDKPPSPSQQSQAKPGNSASAAVPGQSAAQDSTDRLGGTAGQPVEKSQINELAKQLWGHLPERTREQMMQSFSEEFLPKYQREIEDYYRRLSEEQETNRAQNNSR